MKTKQLALLSSAPTLYQREQQRSLAGIDSFDVQVGLTLTPADTCHLVHNTLCLTVTCDSREENHLHMKIGDEYSECIDVSYVSTGQRLRIPLSPALTVLLNKYDIELRSDAQFWIAAVQDDYPFLAPSISSTQQVPDYLSRLCDSGITQFGWMLGCVLDGLYALHQVTGEQRFRDALERYLGHYINDAGLNFEDPRNQIAVNSFHSIELTLPLAAISQLYPQHAAINISLEFLRSRRQDNGLIYDGASITAEGCYTIAYPLMQIGVQRQDQELIAWSWQQLDMRKDALWQDAGIYLRNYDGNKTYHHWARGVCWYFLGLLRTQIVSCEEPTAERLAHIQEIAAYVVQYQGGRGMWYNFFEEADKPIDSSGSAGIACALALAVKRGWLEDNYADRARRCFETLKEHLVDGGFMNCVAPNNKRGEEFQRAEKRSCEPLALGLFCQLHAAIVDLE